MTKTTLPGFGLPLNYVPPNGPGLQRSRFPCALDSEDLKGGYVSLKLTTLREFTMLRLMNQLTDKPKWEEKVFDEEITNKWREEALSTQDIDITPKMLDWCIKELQYKANIFKKTAAVSVYNGDVVKSDQAIPAGIRDALLSEVAKLEDVPARLYDWHPGSDEKVLDLVHPSLFPLVYGKTRVLAEGKTTLEDCITRCGEGEVTVVPPETETKSLKEEVNQWYRPPNVNLYSRKFQWLPCEVDVSGDQARITSYINNLHPQTHQKLYSVIEKIITHTLPLWNMTLTPLKTTYYEWNRIVYTACEYDPDPGNGPETDGPQRLPNEDENTYWERREDWINTTRRVVMPEPEEFSPPTVVEHLRSTYINEETGELKPEHQVDLKRDFKEKGLQIIVKLANIHLTPEKPKYDGGSWHVEGQLNEHICATALYYYDNENVTPSHLAFRQQSREDDASDIDYEQSAHDWLQVVFGCENEETTCQFVGSVETKQDRLLTFPNILQHQVQPFELKDPSKAGHRKILALFLVDPNVRVISTGNVPCQRVDWWSEMVRAERSEVTKLPAELQDQIFKEVEGFPIGMEEAKELRLELMEERKRFVVGHQQTFEENQFSLCEH